MRRFALVLVVFVAVLMLAVAGCQSSDVRKGFQVLDMIQIPSDYAEIGEGERKGDTYRIYHAPNGSVSVGDIDIPKEAKPSSEADLKALSGSDWEYLGIWFVSNPSGSGQCALHLKLARDLDEIFIAELSEREEEPVRRDEKDLVQLTASCAFA